MEPQRPTTLYVSSSQKDEALKQEFEGYLVNLQQARLISGWTQRQVQPGADWSQVIDPRLETAQLFLLLFSPSLLASGYCSGAEFQEAFEQRRRRGEMRVILIFLHHVDVTWHPLGSIVGLPIFAMERKMSLYILVGLARATQPYATDILEGESSAFPKIIAYATAQMNSRYHHPGISSWW